MQNRNIYGKIIVNLLITITLSILALVFLPKLLAFFSPFVVAFILSLIANPMVRFMERKIKIKRKHGTALLIIFVILLLVGLIYLWISTLVKESLHLLEDVPQIASQISELFDNLSVRFARVYNSLPIGVRQVLDDLEKGGREYMSHFLDGFEVPSFQKAQGYIKSVGNAVFMGIVTILATYFLVADHDKISEGANRVFPKSIRKGYVLVAANFKTAVGGYFKAQFKIMVILIIIMFFTFTILSSDYALLLALLIGFIDLLPVFGTGMVFWPWAVIDFVNGNYVRAVVILVLYLVCQVVKQVLQPKMVGDSIGLNPFLSLIFMFIGYRLNGLLGLILGIPIGLVVVSFYKLGVFERIIRGFKIIITDINEYRKY